LIIVDFSYVHILLKLVKIKFVRGLRVAKKIFRGFISKKGR